MGITKQLAKFCADLSYQDIPKDVMECTRQLTFDTIGVAAGGSTSESSEIMKKFIKVLDRPGNGTVIADKAKAAPEYAALLNGAFAHSLDYDDLCNVASLHPGAAIIPAALAACELAGAGGRQFLVGAVVGYDVACRLARRSAQASTTDEVFIPRALAGLSAPPLPPARFLV